MKKEQQFSDQLKEELNTTWVSQPLKTHISTEIFRSMWDYLYFSEASIYLLQNILRFRKFKWIVQEIFKCELLKLYCLQFSYINTANF